MRPEWLVDITAIPRGGRPRNRVSIAGKLKRFFSYSNCSDRLWGHSVCSLGARWAVPGGKVGGGGGVVKLTPHLLPEARLRMIGVKSTVFLTSASWPATGTTSTLTLWLLSRRQGILQFQNTETLRHLICSEVTSQMRRGSASVHFQLYSHRRWTRSISLRKRQIENRRMLRFYMNLSFSWPLSPSNGRTSGLSY